MARSVFEKINAELEMQGEKLYANPRNFASGTLRQLDSQSLLRAVWIFFRMTFWREIRKLFATHWEDFQWLEKRKDLMSIRIALCAKISMKLVEFINEMQAKRDSLDYDIDGVVVKVNRRPAGRIRRDDQSTALGNRL